MGGAYKGENFDYVSFSVASGFYDDAFELELSAPVGWDIYYTVDSSDPSDESMKYDGAIHINDATQNPNQYCLIDDVSLGYHQSEVADIVGNVPNTEWYTIPDYNVDKCTVVRAVAVREEHYSDIYTQVYFVGFHNRNGYDGINVLSIVSDPTNLFDFERGIYVLGETWADYKAKGEFKSDNWSWWLGNYSHRHRAYERPASIHYFDSNHNLNFTQNVGIRIQGNSSRAYSPKNLNLYAREEYGNNKFPDIFGTGYYADTVNLFMGSQDYGTKIRDSLINDLVSSRDVSTRNYVPCVMFLDGEYWGLYYLTEKYDAEWIEYKYSVPAEDAVIFKNHALEVGIDEDRQTYEAMMEFMSTADMSVKENYDKACRLVDIQSLADYYSIMLYIARYNDWPTGNMELWRMRLGNGPGYMDGKWRYMIFDLNSGSVDVSFLGEDSIQRVLDSDDVFHNMCRNKDFTALFMGAMIDLINTCFTYEAVNERVDYYKDILKEPMVINNNRFFGADDYLVDSPFSYQADGFTYSEKVESVRTFLLERRHYMIMFLEQHFGVNIETSDDGLYYIAG